MKSLLTATSLALAVLLLIVTTEGSPGPAQFLVETKDGESGEQGPRTFYHDVTKGETIYFCYYHKLYTGIKYNTI